MFLHSYLRAESQWGFLIYILFFLSLCFTLSPPLPSFSFTHSLYFPQFPSKRHSAFYTLSLSLQLILSLPCHPFSLLSLFHLFLLITLPLLPHHSPSPTSSSSSLSHLSFLITLPLLPPPPHLSFFIPSPSLLLNSISSSSVPFPSLPLLFLSFSPYSISLPLLYSSSLPYSLISLFSIPSPPPPLLSLLPPLSMLFHFPLSLSHTPLPSSLISFSLFPNPTLPLFDSLSFI